MEEARQLVRQAPGLNPRDKAAMLVHINAPGNPGLSILNGVHLDEVKDVVEVYLEERRNAGEERSRITVSILMPVFACHLYVMLPYVTLRDVGAVGVACCTRIKWNLLSSGRHALITCVYQDCSLSPHIACTPHHTL